MIGEKQAGQHVDEDQVRAFEAPSAFAASMNWSSRTTRVAARTTRATRGV